MNSKDVLTSSLLFSYNADEFLTSWNATDVKGRGSFACVRKCEHSKLGKVAVKCFNITGSSEKHDEAIKAIKREMDILLQFDHKNIVQIFGTTRWANYVGIIMEYIDGMNLEDFLISKNVLNIPWLLRLRFFQEFADGLSYLHYYDQNRGFVHGDLKPQNILLTSDMMIKIADFGSVNIVNVSGMASSSTSFSPTTQHTVFYAPPEFLKNPLMKRKPSMDVYSFGMVGYEILTRRQVFQHCINHNIVIQAIIDRGQKPDVTLLRDVESSLEGPQDLEIFKFLENIITQCWSVNAERRPDIREVRNETGKKQKALATSKHIYNLNVLKSKSKTHAKPLNNANIMLNELHFPFLEGPMPSVSSVTTTKETATSMQQQAENSSLNDAFSLEKKFETLTLETRVTRKKNLFLAASKGIEGVSSETLIGNLKLFATKLQWNKDDKLNIISLWVQLHEFGNLSLTQQAAVYFPTCLNVSWIPLNELQVTAMSKVLKYTSKYIERVNMSHCELRTSSFHHFSVALLQSKSEVGELLMVGNKLDNAHEIIYFIHKVKLSLDLWKCFADGRGGWRNLNAEEKHKIQESLNKRENSSLKVRVKSTTILSENWSSS